MKNPWNGIWITLLLLAGCATGGFPTQTATETMKVPMDERIEISLAPGSFVPDQVEFHVKKANIPPDVLRRAKEEIPGGEIGDCEIEYHGSDLYFEVNAVFNGLEQEVMFTPQGEVVSWELEIPFEEVPPMMLKKAEAVIPGATIDKAEQILDAEQNLVAYHFKMEKDGIRYKIVLPLSEASPLIYRETLAEIEVPIN